MFNNLNIWYYLLMIYEIVGWVGAFAILLAYFLVTIKRLDSWDIRYQALNAAGALGIVINSLVHGALPSVGLNLVWLAIAIFGL